MSQVRINPLVKERDFETVYFGNVPYVIEKAFKVFDFEFLRQLYIDNHNRKKNLGYDYYHFQFSSTDEANINDLGIELKQGLHSEVSKPKKEVKKEVKKIDEEAKSEEIEIKETKKVKKSVKKKSLRSKFKF